MSSGEKQFWEAYERTLRESETRFYKGKYEVKLIARGYPNSLVVAMEEIPFPDFCKVPPIKKGEEFICPTRLLWRRRRSSSCH